MYLTQNLPSGIQNSERKSTRAADESGESYKKGVQMNLFPYNVEV